MNNERSNRRRIKRLKKQMNSPRSTPNRFILYRKYLQNRINIDPNNFVSLRELSKMVAQMWEREPPEVKQYWDQVAERMKINSLYRSSFEIINGLDMSVSESEITFVNATASTSLSAIPPGNPSNLSSPDSFSDSQWSLSPQPPQPSLSPLSPLSAQSPLSSQSPLFSQFPLYFEHQQSPLLPEISQSPQSLPYLQSPQLAPDENPSLISSPSPSIDQDFNFLDYDYSSEIPFDPILFGPLFEIIEPEPIEPESIEPGSVESEPDYFW